MNIYLQRLLVLNIILLPLVAYPLMATAAPTDTQSIKRDIRQLEVTLDNTKDRYQDLTDEVTQLEKKLSDIATNYRKTELKIEAAQQRLQEANTKSAALDRDLDEQKAALAEQLQAMYTTGGQSHLRLLLREDAPSDISRNLRYFNYLNEYRMERIERLHKTRAELLTLRETAHTEQQTLAELSSTLKNQQLQLQATLNEREGKLTTLKSDMRTQSRQLAKLQAEEAQLQRTIERLAEQREQAALAAQAAAKAAPPPTSVKQTTKATLETLMGAATPTPTPKRTQTNAETVSYSNNRPFTQLKGKLAWPTSGRILHAYRSRRNEKLQWNGVVIKAEGGAPVRSIAAGKVIFADWRPGYGHVIMVEHDRNYMSLYGYNRVLYKKEGSLIKANEVIAAVGNSGGQNQNGLYFEIRKGVTPMNPAIWCR